MMDKGKHNGNLSRRLVFVLLASLLILHIGWVMPPLHAHATEDSNDDMPKPMYVEFSQLEGKTIAGKTGSVYLALLRDSNLIHSFNAVEYNTHDDRVNALQKGTIDAIITDLPVAESIVNAVPDLAIMPTPVQHDVFGIGVQKDSDLREKVERILAKFTADGTLETMKNVWLGADETKKVLPTLDFSTFPDTAENTLTYFYSNEIPPMAYLDANGTPLGYDIELGMRIAHALKMRIHMNSMNVGSLIPALANGMADMIGGGLSITPKRLEQVDMLPYYFNDVVLIVNDSSSLIANTNSSFLDKILFTLNDILIEDRQYVRILLGLLLTLGAMLASTFLGLLLGIVLYRMETSKYAFLRTLCKLYVRLFKGTPIILICLGIYYVMLGTISVVDVFVIVLGALIHVTAYTPDLLRQALTKNTTPFSHTKLGLLEYTIFSNRKQFRYLFASLSILFFLAVEKLTINDLAKIHSTLRRHMYRDFIPWIVTALVYFGLNVAIGCTVEGLLKKKKTKTPLSPDEQTTKEHLEKH